MSRTSSETEVPLERGLVSRGSISPLFQQLNTMGEEGWMWLGSRREAEWEANLGAPSQQTSILQPAHPAAQQGQILQTNIRSRIRHTPCTPIQRGGAASTHLLGRFWGAQPPCQPQTGTFSSLFTLRDTHLGHMEARSLSQYSFKQHQGPL